MKIEIDGLSEKLKQIGQEHILQFWDELENREKIAFSSQIESINLDQINELYENSKKDEEIDINIISPIKYIDSQHMKNMDKYIEIGETAIKNNKVAVVSMAGGQRN